jgi:branched-chain amino acid transport system substrate-binding protein
MARLTRRTLLGAAAALATPAIARAQARIVKIGVLNDQTSLYADNTGQGSVLAARMAVEELGGRVDNMPVEVVFADHQNRADTGSALARQWYDRDGVTMIADVPNSAVALAIADLTRERNRVFVASGPGTNDLTGRQCTANTVHWTYDNWALANGTARSIVQAGGQSWFFLTADYAFGHDLEAQASAVVRAAGGSVAGAVRHPLNTPDFSSFLLQAQRSRAQIVGLANAGGDTINAIKQAAEFGLGARGQKLAALLISIIDINALGLGVAQGLQFTEAFYWDQNDATRAFARRFAERREGKMPSQIQAGVYAGTLHYLKAVREAGTLEDGAKIVQAMKALPTEDALFGRGSIRPDGRTLHNMYLFEAKAPAQSRAQWDYYNLRNTIQATDAFRPIAEGGCTLAR